MKSLSSARRRPLPLCLRSSRSPVPKLPLKPDDYVGIIGDSITEQKLYSLYMEDYLLMCQPAADLRTTQFGWGGETSWGFAARMENDMLRFHPTVVTTCFGMNDGGYRPMTPDKAKHYREGANFDRRKMQEGRRPRDRRRFARLRRLRHLPQRSGHGR